MTTPFQSLYFRFNNNLPDSDIVTVKDNKRKSFLQSAVTPYMLNVDDDIIIDYDAEAIDKDLTDIQLNLFGLWMFDEYLNQEILKANKLMSISSDAFRISGTGDKVKRLQEIKDKNERKINTILASLL